MVKHPCISCIYFKQCGSTTRTKECKGRQTKRDKKHPKKTGCFFNAKIRKEGIEHE